MRAKTQQQCLTHGQVTCSCGSVVVRCKCIGPVPVTMIDCIHRYTVRELFQELVDHAVAHREENPTRMVYALQRIAKAEHKNIDQVFRELRATVRLRTGSERLPGEAIRA